NLKERASTVWYSIRMSGATDEEKQRIALWGLRPDSPVRLDPSVSAAHVRAQGAVVREAILEVLTDPEMTYEANPWTVVGSATLAKLLEDAPFVPTPDEVASVLENGGEYGKIVMIRYLAAKQDPLAV